jgi:hypothetical protein
MEVNGQLHAPATSPLGKEPRYPLDNKWVGPRVGLETAEKRKIPLSVQESKHQLSYRLNYRIHVSSDS